MNKPTLKLHKDILDKKRQDLLQNLLPFIKGFVLGGGTALALQLAHRLSFDFDFFTFSSIPKKLLEKLSKTIEISNIVVDTSDELTFFTKDNIKVTFLLYPFESYSKPVADENGLLLFPVQEIALQKAYVIGRRGEYRDYFDLYTILKNDFIDLDRLIEVAKKVYGSVFDEKIFLEQLVYFGDLLNFDIVSIKAQMLPNPKEVKQYFEEVVRKHLESSNKG